jgi:hypothetical protein
VDVCEKALVQGRVVGILEEPTCGWGDGLDIPLSVEGKNGNVRNFVVLEALPFLLRKRGGRGGRFHGYEFGYETNGGEVREPSGKGCPAYCSYVVQEDVSDERSKP